MAAAGGDTDDGVLARDLQQRVQELYGSASDNVALSDVDDAKFRALRGLDSKKQETEVRSAWFTLISIGVATAVSIAGFAFLVHVGAVHDATRSARDYEMPAYGKWSYVNPYELLDEDSARLDNKAYEYEMPVPETQTYTPLLDPDDMADQDSQED